MNLWFSLPIVYIVTVATNDMFHIINQEKERVLHTIAHDFKSNEYQPGGAWKQCWFLKYVKFGGW
jgi:hypothetical protein